jgi:hypothetical protein
MPTRGVLHVEARVYEDIELGDIQKVVTYVTLWELLTVYNISCGLILKLI